MQWVENALGRKIPAEIDGRPLKPFRGAFQDQGGGRQAAPRVPLTTVPGRIDKVVRSWDELWERLPLRDGMTVSFHHHLRNGDFIVNEAMQRLAARGLKDLVVAPSALFPVHDGLVELIKSGVISHVEGSMNGQVGVACSKGLMKKTAVLRSHGGRYRAIQDGDLKIDLAIIAAPAADVFGNANGVLGKSAFGPIGIAKADSLYAERVVVVTDNLVPFPCVPMSISGLHVDHVLTVDTIGDPTKIVSGTTKITRSPTQLQIAELAARFVEAAGILRDGFSFQAGAGGISLAFTKFLGERMAEKKIKASFVIGGTTQFLVDLLNRGLIDVVTDGQSFDLVAVQSLRDNPRHVEIDPFISYCQHARGCFAHMLDVAVLGATEIDLDFNVNVNTHSDGLLLHGIGGFADAAAGAGCTIITAPSFRKRIPVLRERVTTVTAPGEVIDVVVTERGLAINPRRQDLLEKVQGKGLPLVTLPQLMDQVHALTGIPDSPRFGERPVAVIEWRDGSVIDVVRQVLD
ncbi:MAG: Citrate lyase alpha chain [Candidatus Ozemobacter sibiricus]|jgi:citrate lyase subunit alpha/citrate CoA-transferase|uniref:Citrate lyase alpha chain n=1 Tax=Candidatus Ozemobacter sibiricus TaxID=2268124 RepID=A0A367ZMB7_9BACT|nr:MAG: Citrate lyase alpha chain [Candidatus Ozemobacter sibiricus]